MRCVLHASLYFHNSFLTLTYDETKDDYHNRLEYIHIQTFKKRLRRHFDYHYDKKIQLFNVHEYGKRGKKHWHLVAFNTHFPDKKVFTKKNGNTYYISDILSSLWPHGTHIIGDVTDASAMYQAQYTQKDFKNGNENNSKKSHSKHSGIGRDYFLLHYKQILSLGYVPFGTRKIPVPRYFEKLAHKHFSHFYEKQNFFDTDRRKKLYTPFKQGQENRQIADLYVEYKKNKEIKLAPLIAEWDDFIEQNLFTKEQADFSKAADNFLYDLKNKQNLKEF